MSRSIRQRRSNMGIVDLPDGAAKESGQFIDATTANKAISQEVLSWEGVSVHEHIMGGVEFQLNHRILGHLHTPVADSIVVADLEFPMDIRNELIAKGRARAHVTDRRGRSGWVTVPMGTAAGVANAIELFRRSYKQAKKGKA